MYFLSSCVPLSVLSHRKTYWIGLTYFSSHTGLVLDSKITTTTMHKLDTIWFCGGPCIKKAAKAFANSLTLMLRRTFGFVRRNIVTLEFSAAKSSRKLWGHDNSLQFHYNSVPVAAVSGSIDLTLLTM